MFMDTFNARTWEAQDYTVRQCLKLKKTKKQKSFAAPGYQSWKTACILGNNSTNQA